MMSEKGVTGGVSLFASAEDVGVPFLCHGGWRVERMRDPELGAKGVAGEIVLEG